VTTVAIVGSRDYPDLKAVVDYVDTLPEGTVVVSGHARGVDQVAEDAARKRGLHVISLPAEWEIYGKAAGYRRNEEIVYMADEVVAFYDGKSRGTAHTMRLARNAGKPLTVYQPR
jgi:predicted Rossmann fold nucleotide-binding protein DprA/Smf involved in DNA uptake